MRVHLQGDADAGQFPRQLLTLGNGKMPVNSNTELISFPDNFCNIVDSTEALKSSVFPKIQDHFKDHTWLCERATLAPKNNSVSAINLLIREQLPGCTTSYRSIDSVVDVDKSVQYSIEFLNSLEPSGMPPHHLLLKVDSPIMLLRNLDAPKLCNGTRLSVKTLMPHVIEATILIECAKGEDVFLPKIPMIPRDMPFEFRPLQCPLTKHKANS